MPYILSRSTVILLLALSITTGCASLGWKSKDSDSAETVPEWKENVRSLFALGDSTGVSRQAREIEKNLGVQ